MNAKSFLKRSDFIVSLVRAARALKRDLRILVALSQRPARISRYLRDHESKKLQLGSARHTLSGWLNTDVDFLSSKTTYMDATQTWPLHSNTFDYVFSEHMIEHIDYQAAQSMLREAFRVLKPGGRVRIATPNLDVMLALHNPEKTEEQRKYLATAVPRYLPDVHECEDVFVINNLFRSWGHIFLYDQRTLIRLIEAAGFHDLAVFAPGNSNDPVLRNLEDHGKEVGEEINQFETIVVEAQKPLIASQPLKQAGPRAEFATRSAS